MLLPVPSGTNNRLWVPVPEKIASSRAKALVICVSILSNLVSKLATFDAVSDIRDKEASSAFWEYLKGAKDTDCVGVDVAVVVVPVEFFFLRTLRTLLRKVEIESVSL